MPQLRSRLRLFRPATRATVSPRLPPPRGGQAPLTVVNPHCFEEHIAGRTYRIEVLPVSATRWRAQIARLPGMPTALMPFYGPTPEQAAQELSRWLALVYNGVTTQ